MQTKYQPKKCKKHGKYPNAYACERHGTFPRYRNRPMLGDTPFHERKFLMMWSLERTVPVRGRQIPEIGGDIREKTPRSMKLGHSECPARQHYDLQTCKCPPACDFCFMQD